MPLLRAMIADAMKQKMVPQRRKVTCADFTVKMSEIMLNPYFIIDYNCLFDHLQIFFHACMACSEWLALQGTFPLLFERCASDACLLENLR